MKNVKIFFILVLTFLNSNALALQYQNFCSLKLVNQGQSPTSAITPVHMTPVHMHIKPVHMMSANQYYKRGFPALINAAATTPHFLQLPITRIFNDIEAAQIIGMLNYWTRLPAGDMPIFTFNNQLASLIGWPYAARIQAFAQWAAQFLVQQLPYPENSMQMISPTQTFVRWNMTGQAVNDEAHVDQSTLTLIKREYYPQFAEGTHVFLNNNEYEVDPKQTLVISGGLRQPILQTSWWQSWWNHLWYPSWHFQNVSVPHKAGLVRQWDLVIFVAIQPR